MAKPGKTGKWAARSERLAAALRENLKRRKEQARGRADSRASEANSPAKDATMERAGPDFCRNRGRE
jgi:hypothetical protein